MPGPIPRTPQSSNMPLQSGFFTTNNILTGLPTAFSSRLLASAKQISLTQGQSLFQKGDAGDGCYWLDRGNVKVTIISGKGEQRILAVLGPGSIVGELAMIDGLPRSANVEAIRDCSLSFVSRNVFTACLSEDPKIYNYLVTTLASRLRQADDEAAATSFLTVKARVARALLGLAQHLGQDIGSGQIAIQHKICQSDLAAMAGVARESVSRTLAGWKRRNIIGQSARYDYIVNKTKLARETVSNP